MPKLDNPLVPFAILASIKMQQELRPAKIAQQEKIWLKQLLPLTINLPIVNYVLLAVITQEWD